MLHLEKEQTVLRNNRIKAPKQTLQTPGRLTPRTIHITHRQLEIIRFTILILQLFVIDIIYEFEQEIIVMPVLSFNQKRHNTFIWPQGNIGTIENLTNLISYLQHIHMMFRPSSLHQTSTSRVMRRLL